MITVTFKFEQEPYENWSNNSIIAAVAYGSKRTRQ